MGSTQHRLTRLGLRSGLIVCIGAPVMLCSAASYGQGMLTGCRLENGSLQCVPGLTASPQQQIQVLEGQITADHEQEGRIEQSIAGLHHFVLEGDAREGTLIRARLKLDGSSIESVHIHWYRRAGDGPWQLVTNDSESSYRLKSEDAGQAVMAVLTVTNEQGSVSRVKSNTIGPVVGP